MNESKEIVKRPENMVEKREDLVTMAPVVDVYENEDEVLLHADMPGVAKEEIFVSVDNGKLEISGIRNLEARGVAHWQEFGSVQYRRVFSVPQSIDVSRVNAEYRDGSLQLHLPKAEAAKPRTIEVQSA